MGYELFENYSEEGIRMTQARKFAKSAKVLELVGEGVVPQI